MNFKYTYCLALVALLSCCNVFAQHRLTISAELDTKRHMLQIEQEIVYKNESSQPLDTIYFLDWANSFSSKKTPLAKRFSYDFKSNFHFEKDEDRGKTLIHYIANSKKEDLQWNRYKAADIIRVVLDKTIAPGESYTFTLLYEIQLPDAKFTRFGHLKNGGYNLKYWYISPAVFSDGQWHLYSNKNLGDFYNTPNTYNILFKAPKSYHLVTDIDAVSHSSSNGLKTTQLYGENRKEVVIYLEEALTFESVISDSTTVLTNIPDDGLFEPVKAIHINRIIEFLEDKLGVYPFDKLVISEANYRNSPVYGLNQLPNFIRPFPDGFQYDMEHLKTITHFYLQNTLQIDPRKDYWIYGALQIYLMMEYADLYYPEMKIAGNLSNIWGLRWFHAASLEFNDQYAFLYNHITRINLAQSLTTPKDSLVKFNANIASSYKGGVGLRYLKNYLGNGEVASSIKTFYKKAIQEPVKPKLLDSIIQTNTDKNIRWFFDEYVGSDEKYDYKIKSVNKVEDSLEITIKNKRNNTMPIHLYTLKKDNIIEKRWIEGFDSIQTIKVPARNADRVALNYEEKIPEINKRNNYKKVKGLFKKPVQFRLLQDVEDPKYDQLFFMPVFNYNLYDGFSLGAKLYNKTVLRKNLNYKIEPLYGFNSQTIVGGAAAQYTHDIEDKNLFYVRYGASGSYFSYDNNLFYKKLIAYASLGFREKDLRSNKRGYLNFSNVTVHRDEVEDQPHIDEPNYNVFNIQYVYSDINLIDHFTAKADYEIAANFHKVYTTLEYRKLFLSNRQLNLRLFAGTFIFNDTNPASNFYSFALDRPTDYLFDYNYYGRSEDSGLFSQQLIMAEGGFKAKLDTPYANRWMTTLNASTSIWRWIFLYGDVGLVNNRNVGTKLLYDSGIRISLVTDFFEIYFPMYSSNGWEPGLPNYDQRIRFIVTLHPQTLMKLFTRKWY